MDYLNHIGRQKAMQYNLVPGDHTHLNRAGTLLFGIIVSGLIDGVVRGEHGKGIEGYTHPNEMVWDVVLAGRFILPSD
jgi:hypothetical protein